MDLSLGLYEDPTTRTVILVRYNTTPLEADLTNGLIPVEMLYNGDFERLEPPLNINVVFKDIIPLKKKYIAKKEYPIYVIGESKSSGYLLRSHGGLALPVSRYPLYGSGIYGVSCSYRLPDSQIINLKNPFVISNAVETKLAERVFRKTLEYFDKGGDKMGVINGWNILISLTDQLGGTEILEYLSSEFFDSIYTNWKMGQNMLYSHSQLWIMLKDLDSRLMPSPITVIMTTFYFDGIVTLNPKSTACVMGNIIYPPHTGKLVYAYL